MLINREMDLNGVLGQVIEGELGDNVEDLEQRHEDALAVPQRRLHQHRIL